MEAVAHRARLLTVRLLLYLYHTADCWRPNPHSSCWDVSGANKKKAGTLAGFLALSGGRYWDRTSDFHRVKVALYR